MARFLFKEKEKNEMPQIINPLFKDVSGSAGSSILDSIINPLPPGYIWFNGKKVKLTKAGSFQPLGGTVQLAAGVPLQATTQQTGATSQTAAASGGGGNTQQPGTTGGGVQVPGFLGGAQIVSGGMLGPYIPNQTAAPQEEEPWYKKYLWLEVVAALLVLALAVWLILKKKK